MVDKGIEFIKKDLSKVIGNKHLKQKLLFTT